MENTIIFIMGVSGSGKSTLLEGLLSSYRDFAKVQSYTSRPMRIGEIPGDKYNFISLEEFKRGITNDEFLEYALVHQKNYYGTKKQDIKEKFHMGLTPIKEIDMHGLSKLQREENPIFNYFSIFLNVPEDVMLHRIQLRGTMDYEEVQRRLHSSYEERAQARELCDFVVDASGDIKETLEQVCHIIDEEFIKKQ